MLLELRKIGYGSARKLMDEKVIKQLINSMSDYVTISDLDANFTQVNYHQTKIMGYKTDKEIVGNTYHRFKGIPTGVAEGFVAEDIAVIKNKKPMRFLSYYQYNDGEWHLLLGDKSLIFDDKGNVTGIFSLAKDVTNSGLIDVSRFMFDSGKKYREKKPKAGFGCIITDIDEHNLFSKKEMLVIFYFLRGKTAKEIAHIISRSEKTVHFHLDAIKVKANVTSKSDLLEKLIHDGYMNIVPEGVFKTSDNKL